MFDPDPARFDLELQRQYQLAVIATSLDAQLNAAITQIKNLSGLTNASPACVSAQDAIDTSFKTLRRARVLVEVFGDTLVTQH